MQAFHSEPNARKRDEIAATTLHLLRQHYGRELSVTNVKDLFNKLRDVVDHSLPFPKRLEKGEDNAAL
jgi:hypothetical protein